MKKRIRIILAVIRLSIFLTVGLPIVLGMAFGYWVYSSDGVTFYQSLKKILL